MSPVTVRAWMASLFLAVSLHSQSIISTIAGTDFVFPAGISNPLNAPFGASYGLAIDDTGALYVGDCDNNQIFRIAPSGAVTIVAGNGLRGGGGDGPALGIRTPCPSQLTFDRNGELLFVTNYSALRRLTKDGRVVTIAGGIPFAGIPSPDGIPASQTIFLNSGGRDGGLAVDAAGNIYFTDVQSNRVRRFGADGLVRTVAGNGTQGFSGDNGPGASAQLNTPTGLAVAPDGTLLIADSGNNRIRAVSPDGAIRTIAGNGATGIAGDNGTALQAAVGRPQSILIEPGGSLLILQSSPNTVRRISATGVISTIVNANAGISFPSSPVRDASGNIYFSDSGNARLRKLDAANRLTLFAGNGNYRRSPDRAPALTSWLDRPVDVAISPAGLVTFSDTFENGSIRQVDASGRLVRLAGPLNRPNQIAFDAQGNLYMALRFGCAIGKLTPSGQYSIVAGTGVSGFSGDGGPSTRATLCPAGVAVNAAGEIFIADSQNNRIRKVSTDGIIRTIAGTGGPGLRDLSVPALEAALGNPTFLLLDPAGNLFFSDTGSNSVRKLSPDGIVTVIAGGREPGFSGDGGPALQAQLNSPQGLARDALGNIYVADTGNARVRLIRTTLGNSIVTVAGGGRSGVLGDGGAPESAALLRPSGVALDSSGRLYIADSFNDRIRQVANVATTFSLSADSLTVSSLPTSLNITSPIVGLAYTATASVPWLNVTPASGSLPASLQVSANTASLAPGTYTGAVNVSVPFASPSIRQVAVSVTVEPAPPPRLLVGLQNVALEMLTGGEGPSGVVPLSNQGGGIVSYNVSASAPWLKVSPATGQIPASGAVTVSLKVDPGALSVGTYSSTITVSDGASAYRVPVTLSISATRARIVVSQPGLSFTVVQGGGAPAPQSLGIFNDGAGPLVYEAKATTLSGGNWLTLSNASGRVERPLDDVGFVGVQPAGRNLAPGDYYAEIRVTSPNAPTPQLVTVLLKVLPAGSNPGPEIRPSSLVFVGTPSSPPATQDIRISNLLDKSLSFVSASSTVDGASWLTHLPSAAAINPDEPARVVVQSEFAGLAPGVRRGVVTLAFDDGSVRTLPVLTIIASAAALPNNKTSERAAASCASTSLRNEFLSIPEGAVVTPGQPVAVEVKVVDDCGNLLFGNERNANSAVYAKFSNGDPDLRLVPTGNGVWTGAWRPANPATGTVTVSAVSVFVQGLFLQAGRTDRGIRIGTGAGVPIVRPGSLVHSASQRGDAPVAPGTLVTLYGSDLAPAPRATNVPLPTEVDGTQVLLAGQPLPILYSSQSQINAQIPYGLPVNTTHQVVVRRSATLSVPESFTVAATQPGIFTLNQQGTGQGIVMGPDQLSLAVPASPAERGKAIVIYCAGLGAVSPAAAVGVPAPNSPLSQSVNPVAVTIGGFDAPVFFAGLTPGFTGLYQVNALVPNDAPTGDAVELVIATAGQTSNTVTLAIR